MWQLGIAADAAGSPLYLAIALAILRPLMRVGQLRSNPLATATAAVFLTLSVRYDTLAVHALGPSFGCAVRRGEALRATVGWETVQWDLLIAAIGIYYWTLRRSYAPLLAWARLFEDMKERQRRAIEANDEIVQDLYLAETALYLNKPEVSEEALRTALDAARQLISDLAGESVSPIELGPGDLVRERAALDSLARPWTASPGATAPGRVLIADDASLTRLLLRQILERSGAFVVVGEAADGGAAVALASSEHPDMVLLDLSMPVLDGLEAILRIRECSPDSRIVVLSGFTAARMERPCLNQGADAYIEKRDSPDKLLARLVEVSHMKAKGPAEGLSPTGR